MIKRQVIIEKYKKPDYVDSYGNNIWLDRYGEVIRAENKNGEPTYIARKGQNYVGAGFIYAPYIPAFTNPHVTISESRAGSANWLVCGVDVAKALDESGLV